MFTAAKRSELRHTAPEVMGMYRRLEALFQEVHLEFLDAGKGNFRLRLLDGERILAGPVEVPGGKSTVKMVNLCCGLLPQKFGSSYFGGKEVSYNLVVLDIHTAREWLQARMAA